VEAIPVESGLSYQWRFNGTNDIPDATNASFTLYNAQAADAGRYSVEVTNIFGSMVSSNAVLLVDYPPIADASATRSTVISANGANATVVLDGSRSSDPQHESLQYWWWEQGLATPLATGVVAVVVLPVGTQPIYLIVNDEFGAATNGVSISVLTTSQGVQRLMLLLGQAGLAHPLPLISSLQAALASINRGNSVAAANELHAFQNKVRAQVMPSNSAFSNILVLASQQVIDALQKGCSDELATRAQAVKRPDGKVKLRFRGRPGQTYIVEGSTNLLDWEMIGLGQDRNDGSFDFEDVNAAGFANRFYRIVNPEDR
jgi:hypothetical protein